MKRLTLVGYAPAKKKAWPCAHLGSELEALDERHGVFPNHVIDSSHGDSSTPA